MLISSLLKGITSLHFFCIWSKFGNILALCSIFFLTLFWRKLLTILGDISNSNFYLKVSFFAAACKVFLCPFRNLSETLYFLWYPILSQFFDFLGQLVGTNLLCSRLAFICMFFCFSVVKETSVLLFKKILSTNNSLSITSNRHLTSLGEKKTSHCYIASRIQNHTSVSKSSNHSCTWIEI